MYNSGMKNVFKEILKEFYADGVPSAIVPRDVEYYEQPAAATVVKGMRRTGKTFVTYARIKELLDSGAAIESIVHLNFEDDRLRSARVEDLKLIAEAHAELCPEASKHQVHYFLDELQNITGWEAYARRLVDSPRIQLCLTGSSSKLLSEEIATEMRGRSVSIEVFPLSFSEFLRFNGYYKDVPRDGVYTANDRGVLRNAMTRYMEVGGFPAVQGMPDRIRIATLQDYVHAVVYRDVLQRHKVTSVQSLQYTLDYLLHNFARRTSAHAISGVLKNLAFPSRREDIASYIAYFKDAYLVYPVSVLSDSLAVKRVNPDKYYIVDAGLITATTTKVDAEKGWKLENLVYLALRRGLNKINYYSLEDSKEVDFHVFDHLTKQRRLIQVTWEIDKEGTFDREVSALRQARRLTGIENCTIVTWDTEKVLDDGIKVVPIWKWLLEAGEEGKLLS